MNKRGLFFGLFVLMIVISSCEIQLSPKGEQLKGECVGRSLSKECEIYNECNDYLETGRKDFPRKCEFLVEREVLDEIKEQESDSAETRDEEVPQVIGQEDIISYHNVEDSLSFDDLTVFDVDSNEVTNFEGWSIIIQGEDEEEYDLPNIGVFEDNGESDFSQGTYDENVMIEDGELSLYYDPLFISTAGGSQPHDVSSGEYISQSFVSDCSEIDKIAAHVGNPMEYNPRTVKAYIFTNGLYGSNNVPNYKICETEITIPGSNQEGGHLGRSFREFDFSDCDVHKGERYHAVFTSAAGTYVHGIQVDADLEHLDYCPPLYNPEYECMNSPDSWRTGGLISALKVWGKDCPYLYSPGYFESREYDAGQVVVWDNYDISGGNLDIYFETSFDGEEWEGFMDYNEDEFYSVYEGRYARYGFGLSTNNPNYSPRISSVEIGYQIFGDSYIPNHGIVDEEISLPIRVYNPEGVGSTVFDVEVWVENNAPEWSEINFEGLNENFGNQLIISDLKDYVDEPNQDSLEFGVLSYENIYCEIVNYYQLKIYSEEGYVGPASCELIVSDGFEEDTVTAEFYLNNVNDAPEVESLGYQETVYRGDSIDITVNGFDVDEDDLEYILEYRPDYNNLWENVCEDWNGNVCTLNFGTEDYLLTTWHLRAKVSDGDLFSFWDYDMDAFEVLNNVPEIVNLPENFETNEDVSLELSFGEYVQDVEDGYLGDYYVNSQSNYEVIDCDFVSDSLECIPLDNQYGNIDVEISYVDSEGDSVSEVIRIDVIEENDPPIWIQDIDTFVGQEDFEDFTYVQDLSEYVLDVDGDPISFEVLSTEGVDCEIIENILSLDLSSRENWNGETACEISLQDNRGPGEIRSFDIVVEEVNDVPIWSEDIGNIDITQNFESETHIENLLDYVTDIEGDSISFAVQDEDLNKVDCEIGENNELILNPISGQCVWRTISTPNCNSWECCGEGTGIECSGWQIPEDWAGQGCSAHGINCEGGCMCTSSVWDHQGWCETLSGNLQCSEYSEEECESAVAENLFEDASCVIGAVDENGGISERVFNINVIPPYNDCEGTLYGNAYEDDCGVCDSNLENDNQCTVPQIVGQEFLSIIGDQQPTISAEDLVIVDADDEEWTLYPVYYGSSAENYYLLSDFQGGYSIVISLIEDFVIPVYVVDDDGQASDIFDLEIRVCETEEECESFDTFVLNLETGNNFVSFQVLPYDRSTLNVLSSIENNVNFIIGSGLALFHNFDAGEDEIEWSGNLNEIRYERGYWINVNDDVDLVLEGQRIEPDAIYELGYGNNKISYPLESCQNTLDVIPEEVKLKTNFIQGQGLSLFHRDEDEDGVKEEDEWSGNLNWMCPGEGYDINVDESLEFSFVDSSIQQSPIRESNLFSFFKNFFRNI